MPELQSHDANFGPARLIDSGFVNSVIVYASDDAARPACAPHAHSTPSAIADIYQFSLHSHKPTPGLPTPNYRIFIGATKATLSQ